MKNKIYTTSMLLVMLVTTLFISSCNEYDFLKENPKDNLYADNLYLTGEGFQLSINAMLEFVREEREEPVQSAEFGFGWKIGVDNGWAPRNLSWLRGPSLYQTDWSPSMQWINGGEGVWGHMYRTINTANMVLSRSENPDIDWGGVSVEENEAIKQSVQSHAHFFRAWAYRHLVLTFGDVPISTEEINGSNWTNDWERAPLEQVRSLIIEDLIEAEKGLAENSNDVRAVSKAVAQHYLAEMYIWAEEPELAVQAAQRVLDNPNYALITDRYGVKANEPGVPFMDQFYQGNIMPGEGNTEALWILPNNDTKDYIGSSRNSMRRTWVVNYASPGYAEYSPEYGGRGLGSCAITAWGFSIYEDQDHRFSEFAVQKEYVNQRTGVVTTTQTEEQYMTQANHRWASTKKWDWTFTDPALWGDSYSYADQMYLRLADTYLLMAEAQLMANGPEAALPYINAIRERSNATPATAGEIDLDYILDERSRELVTEEYRRQTLVRTGTFYERTKLYNPLAAENIEPYHQWYPLPLAEIDITGMTQNQWQ